ncbi:MAG: hypothetical protein ACUVQF_05350 [Fervidobacterium sp.]|uniref:hypothetical protein n=1 Tax=Fervidobacterium sp. TaxID=1871331 RepID=UPI00404B4B6F
MIKLIKTKIDDSYLFLLRLIVYITIFAFAEFTFAMLFGYKVVAIGILIGTAGMVLGLFSLLKGKKRIVSLADGKIVLELGYFIRYLLYTSLFLFSAIAFGSPLQGILGVFVGLFNAKIVAFLFAWRWLK